MVFESDFKNIGFFVSNKPLKSPLLCSTTSSEGLAKLHEESAN
jgi:hypothetical protein